MPIIKNIGKVRIFGVASEKFKVLSKKKKLILILIIIIIM
jgi:hypothetical protein